MAGEIHGLISREDAWRSWKPYGDRVKLDGTLDPTIMTNADALQIVLGADPATQGNAFEYWSDNTNHLLWYAGLADLDLQNEAELVDLLSVSQMKQHRSAERKRTKAIDNGLDFAKKLGQGVLKLQHEGLLTSAQAELMDSWIIAPDGQPFMQYMPMSQLEYARLALKYDKEEQSAGGTDCTDFNLGILRSASGSLPYTTIQMQHNKVHESVHGFLSGVEIHDITREDGWRRPDATVVGLFAYEPSTEIVAGDDFGAVENVELNEGWTDYIARELIRVEPGLGKELKDARGYAEWAKVIGRLRSDSPDIYTAITNALLVEATPTDPTRKRQALADMHEYADRQLDTTNALGKLFLEHGGSILDIYDKGKKAE